MVGLNRSNVGSKYVLIGIYVVIVVNIHRLQRSNDLDVGFKISN